MSRSTRNTARQLRPYQAADPQLPKRMLATNAAPLYNPLPQVPQAPMPPMMSKSAFAPFSNVPTILKPNQFVTQNTTTQPMRSMPTKLPKYNDDKDVMSKKRKDTSSTGGSAAKRQKVESSETAQKRLEDRAEKSRNASRLYRQRKKQFTEELKQQLAAVARERDNLKQQFEKQAKILQRLTEENAELRLQLVSDSQVVTERYSLLQGLSGSMESKGKEQQQQQSLENTVKSLEALEKFWQIHHLAELVQPDIVSYLCTTDMVTNVSKMAKLRAPREGLRNLTKKLQKEFKTSLTPEQNQSLDQLLVASEKQLDEIDGAKAELNNEFETLFRQKLKHNSESTSRPYLDDLLNMTLAIDKLRKMLMRQTKIWKNHIAKVKAILTLEQYAQFLINMEYQHQCTEQVKYLWAAVHSKQAAFRVNENEDKKKLRIPRSVVDLTTLNIVRTGQDQEANT